MTRQPNIDPPDQDLPRAVLTPAAPARWSPSRPGMITAPDQISPGGLFGRPGPDTGWAFRIVRSAGLSEEEMQAEAVLVTLMAARASLLGRAPVPEDLDVARIVMGYEGGASDRMAARRRRWLKESRHEPVPGAGAAQEIGTDLLAMSPGDLRSALSERD